MCKKYLSPFFVLLAWCAVLSLCSCSEDNSISRKDIDIDDKEVPLTDIQLVDLFAIGTLESFYFWIDEPGMLDRINAYLTPDTCCHPVETLKKVVSSEDRWTMLTDRITELKETSDGIETTVGIDASPVRISNATDEVFFVVNFVYKNSPAEQAGIKRGDIFNRINDRLITLSNYTDFYYNKTTIKLGMAEIYEKGNNLAVRSIDLTYTLSPVKLTEDPLLASNIFEINDKKVGYFAYASFTEDTDNLEALFERFCSEGVSELVVDLRYNGGGYVSTCEALGSLMAPKAAVAKPDVFIKNCYNNALTAYYEKKNEVNVTFQKKFLDSNPDLKKIYFLTSSNTASASEMLIVGLSSYVDVVVIGTKTHGKFCSGLLLTPEDVYTKESYEKYKSQFHDWGIYVMIGTYSDKDGKNACRPNGISPDYELADYPYDGYQLGDENEYLLMMALILAGKDYPDLETRAQSTRASSASRLIPLEIEKPSFAIQQKPDRIHY